MKIIALAFGLLSVQKGFAQCGIPYVRDTTVLFVNHPEIGIYEPSIYFSSKSKLVNIEHLYLHDYGTVRINLYIDSIGKIKTIFISMWDRESCLVQMMDNYNKYEIRRIIHSGNPCNFMIIEPSGDSVSFNFDTKKDENEIKKQQHSNNLPEGQQVITYYQYSECKRYRELKKKKFLPEENVFIPDAPTASSSRIEHKYVHDYGVTQINMIIDSTGKTKDFSISMSDRESYLVQMLHNREIRTIIHGSNPCDFTIIEPSGDSTVFNLDTRNKDVLKKHLNSLPEGQQTIAYHQYYMCEKYKELEKGN